MTVTVLQYLYITGYFVHGVVVNLTSEFSVALSGNCHDQRSLRLDDSPRTTIFGGYQTFHTQWSAGFCSGQPQGAFEESCQEQESYPSKDVSETFINWAFFCYYVDPFIINLAEVRHKLTLLKCKGLPCSSKSSAIPQMLWQPKQKWSISHEKAPMKHLYKDFVSYMYI